MPETATESASVLKTIKRSLDIATDDTSFDTVLLLHINSVFSDLYQLGLGVYGSIEKAIEDEDDQWTTILGNQKNLNMVKSYIALRVRLMFDPPESGFLTTAIQDQIVKMEWRIRDAAKSSPNGDVEEVIPPLTPAMPSIWNLTGGLDFPPEAPIDAIGVDIITGEVWKKE